VNKVKKKKTKTCGKLAGQGVETTGLGGLGVKRVKAYRAELLTLRGLHGGRGLGDERTIRGGKKEKEKKQKGGSSREE